MAKPRRRKFKRDPQTGELEPVTTAKRAIDRLAGSATDLEQERSWLQDIIDHCQMWIDMIDEDESNQDPESGR